MEELSEEKKQKIIWLRNLLKANAPNVYNKFAQSKIFKETKKPEKQMESNDFIKGLEGDKEKLKNVIPF